MSVKGKYDKDEINKVFDQAIKNVQTNPILETFPYIYRGVAEDDPTYTTPYEIVLLGMRDLYHVLENSNNQLVNVNVKDYGYSATILSIDPDDNYINSSIVTNQNNSSVTICVDNRIYSVKKDKNDKWVLYDSFRDDDSIYNKER